jgi:nucleotide-binding universal stress UspA family protein
MAPERRFLVASDLSEPADEAIREAHRWAIAWQAELVVCVVVSRYRADEQGAEARIRARVQALTGRDPASFRVVIDAGTPHAQIVREAEALGSQLLVVASHGHPRLVHLFLGEVAERVVRHARSSVLVVRPHPPTGRMLVGTDFSTPSVAAVIAAVERAKLTGARVTLVHDIGVRVETAVWMATGFGSGFQFVPDEYRTALTHADQQLQALIKELGVEAERRVTDKGAAASLVALAGELEADLVVVGAVGESGVRRHPLGSVAERVVRAAPASVWVVRV